MLLLLQLLSEGLIVELFSCLTPVSIILLGEVQLFVASCSFRAALIDLILCADLGICMLCIGWVLVSKPPGSSCQIL